MPTKNSNPNKKQSKSFHNLFNHILNISNSELTRIDFLKNTLKIIMDFSKCRTVELWLKEQEEKQGYEVVRYTKQSFYKVIPDLNDNLGLIKLCEDIIKNKFDHSLPFFTEKGTFYSGNMEKLLKSYSGAQKNKLFYNIKISKKYQSLAIIPLTFADELIGLLQLKSKKSDYFSRRNIELFENFSQTFGLLLLNQRSQAALRERIKELACLHEINQTVEKHGESFDKTLQNIVLLFPSAWQYPDITCSSIELDGQIYSTPNFKESPYTQSADIVVNDKKTGSVNIIYTEEKPILDEGPFLKEERFLINSIARKLTLIIERKLAMDEKSNLQKQLLHTERLATIGQLSAGIAHELNEPLESILGFSQLVKKDLKDSKQAEQDIEKIIKASLHAREVVKKLLIFARQMPIQMIGVNLNKVVEEGLYFLESRCAKEGIQLIHFLDKNLPLIHADPSQLTQALVNLVTNAIQAMPQGGKLVIKTLLKENHVSLIVEDTGIGMNENVINKILLPFFTTKDIGQGTGLGMSVVDGIVTSHKGLIKIDSKLGHGSKIEIQLPINIKENIQDEPAF